VASILLIWFSDRMGIGLGSAIRISFVLTAVWWLVFTIPMLKHVKQIHGIEREREMFKRSLRRLVSAIQHVRKHRTISLFLLAYFFYIDGVGTIIRMAAVYGTTLGIGMEMMMLVLISIQIVAFPCSILYGRLSERFGSRRMIPAGIAVYILICILGFYMQTLLHFWGVAMLVASVQGGLQAISRSHFSKMIPKDNANKFFGIYDIFGKFAAILGPTLFAVVSQVMGSSRYGILSIVVQFTIGGTLFLLSQRKVHS
jgi:UMF1 family MFS transporter